jgi:hypothetical protein
MNEKLSCYLCGLQSDYLPPISGRDLIGISCKRCGNYYIDGLLAACGEPKNEEDRAILSGFTRWQKELDNPIPEITTENIDKIIQDNRDFSDQEKVDKLLLYYSRKHPNKGSYANYDYNLDYAISYSKNSDEFIYLLQKVADKSLGLIKVEARGVFQILPEGWERAKWLEKVELADAKFNIESNKIRKRIKEIEAQVKERFGDKGLRFSSPLARRIKRAYLNGAFEKIDKKLEIDKDIIRTSPKK